MTTIIGVTGYNKKAEKYVLFASDSQASEFGKDDRLTGCRYNAKKIFTNLTESMMFAYAGDVIFPPKKNENPKLREETQKLISLEKSPTWVIRSSFDELNRIKKNQYLFANQSDLMLHSYNVSPFGVESNLSYEGAGSGYEKIPPTLKKINPESPWGHEMGIQISDVGKGRFQNVLRESFGIILEAAKSDEFTGGHFDFGLITGNGVFIKRNFAELDNKKNPDELFTKGVKKVLGDYFAISRKIKSIDDLVLS